MAKLVHLTSAHSYDDIRIFWKYCRFLANHGHECHLVALGNSSHIEDGVNVHCAGRKPPSRLWRLWIGTWQVYRTALKIGGDIFHFHDPELIPAGLALRLRGCKVVYDVHEDVPEDILLRPWIPKPVRKLLSIVFRHFENWAARQFTGIVAATPHIRDRFLKQNVTAVAIRNYAIANELFDAAVPWSDKEKAVCYVGGISEDRGLFDILAGARLADTKLLMAGRFFTTDERARAEASKGWENVENLGFVGRREVAKILGRSIAGLVVLRATPKFVHSLPIKMFEYMSAGIPVICSNFEEWRAIIEKDDCGYCVPPEDPAQIAAAIQNLLGDPENAKRMGDNGRKAVLEKYCWEKEFPKILHLYAEIL